MHLCKMILLSHIGQCRLGISQYVPATSQMGQAFLGTNQKILLLIKNRKSGQNVRLDKLVSLVYVKVIRLYNALH